MFFNNSIIVVLIGACIQVKLCSRAARRPINNIISLETCKLMEYHDCCVLIVFIYASMVCWQQGGHIHPMWKCQKIFQYLGSTFVTIITRFARSRVHCFYISINWELYAILSLCIDQGMFSEHLALLLNLWYRSYHRYLCAFN